MSQILSGHTGVSSLVTELEGLGYIYKNKGQSC